MKFSEKLALAMREKNMSIRELSEKTGVPKSAIQRYTSGDTEKIPIDRMKLMAEALGIDPASIMGWDQPQDHLHALGEHLTSASRSKEWRMISQGFEEFEKKRKPEFMMVFNMLSKTYPEFFGVDKERNDDDDPES